MPYSRIIIQFTDVPAINQYVEFYEDVTTVNLKETVKVNRSSAKQVKRPVGYDAGTEETPVIIYSEWISENYKTAFNLDYNPGNVSYDVSVVNDEPGSGTGTVTIVAKFPNAVFSEVNTPAGVTITIENEEYVDLIQIDEVSTLSGPAVCENVNVEVTTNILAVKILSPELIDPNTDNPFTLIVNRGDSITITVQDENGAEASQDYTAPPLLDEGDFTLTIDNDLTGATVTVVGLPSGLVLQYGLGDSDLQDSNVFTGVAPGVYSVVIKDQFGCAIAKAFTIDEINTPIILSRSPYFSIVQATDVPFDSATLDLRVWAGDVVADRPASPTYNMSKIAIQAGQQKIDFDLHHLVNDFVKNWYTYFIQGQGAFTVSSRDTVFVEALTTAKYLGDVVGTDSRRYLAVDGFGWHRQGFNPEITEKVLSSVTKHFFYGSNCPLYFITKGLVSIVVNGIDVPFTFSQSSNNQVVAYINAAAYAPGNLLYSAALTYGDGVVTHQFQKLSECKYKVATCYFKNKFGFWETIPFAKLSKKGLDVASTDYETIVSEFGEYDPTRHVNRNYNLQVGQRITVNTDHIPESYNALFKELMASEFIYLEQDGDIVPVNRAKTSWDEKTRTNDKLIQYSMDFKYSFNEINQVQ